MRRGGFGRQISAIVGLAVLTASATTFAQDTAQTTTTELPEVQVIGTTPLSSPRTPRRPARSARSARPSPAAPVPPLVSEPAARSDPTVIDRDKVPSTTQTLTAEDVTRTGSPTLTDTLLQRVPSVAVSDPNGNGAQQEIKYRGFYASPTQGTPQGLAVYMNGIRLNEAFGDTVNFDLIPTNAIDRTDIWSNNPVFGLNALGGALNIGMKNGFTWHGLEAEVSGGSFGRLAGAAQFGGEHNGTALYLAAQTLTDKGWRQRSPAQIDRVYGDFGWKGERAEIHAIAAMASTSFGVAAATPIQFLERDWSSIYTTPQTTANQMALFAINGRYEVSDTWTVQSNVYLRRFAQAHVDGNDAEVERCAGSGPFANTLCLDDDNFPGASTADRQILTSSNQPISCPAGTGNTCRTTPYGTVDRTWTKALTAGGSLQASSIETLFGHGNHFTIGGSIDQSSVRFDATSELGFIFPDLSVGPNSAIPGTGDIIHTASNIGYGPVSIDARNTYYGLFATDTFDVTSRLATTFGARFNLARITVMDLLGTSPELNSSPNYAHLNPLAGVTYKLTRAVTAYAGYSESNRAPTPLELGCSSPSRPCLLEGFLVADPPLQQVTGRTYETGLRGRRAVGAGQMDWKVGLFRTDLKNDIIQVASTIPGRGFFQNVAGTRRQGLEAAAEFRSAEWLAYASYSFIDATYRFTGDLASPNNPMADADGNVHVTPGKHIPMIPPHQFKAGVDYKLKPAWTVGANVVAVSSQYFAGDPANQNDRLPAYWVANLSSTYQINKHVQLFGRINNLFNRKYALFGTYFDPQGTQNVPLAVPLTDRRAEVPGQPLSVYVGLRGTL